MSVHDDLMRKRAIREAGGDPYRSPAPLDENEQLAADIKDKATEVGVTHAAFEEAIMEERDVAAKLITRAIKDIMPALPALVGKLEFKSVKKTIGGSDGAVSMQQVSQEHHDKRGTILVDRFNAVQQDRDTTGTYGGVSLYLLEDGHLAFGHRDGTWSRVPGAESVLYLALLELDVESVLTRFRIEAILAGMAAALNNQNGLVGATEKVRARVAKLAVALNTINDMLR